MSILSNTKPSTKAAVIISLALILGAFAASVWAGSGSMSDAGVMDFVVNFRYQPTQADIDRLKDAIRDAADQICDVTDGQVHIGTVRITGGAADEDAGDIWLYAENARSGLSFYTDGSSLGRLGMHINLYNDDVNGAVIAHELGHHAFGLGDEYDEQPRCIGPCFEAGTTDNQNATMMQNANATEFCISTNHDLLRGDGITCDPACVYDGCEDDWNTTTNRWETTQQTKLHNESCWETLEDNYPTQITAPAGLPVAAQPAGCRDDLVFIDDIEGSDQIMLFIDRSGSMSSPVREGSEESRLDFAKAAARAFVDLRAGTGAWVGLISFEETPSLDRHLEELTAADAGGFRNIIDGLTAGGWTGIGTALSASFFEFDAAEEAGRTRSAFLLSDGENNRGGDPEEAARNLNDRGVRVFTIPVGSSADRDLLSDMAGENGGFMYDAPDGDELPPIYMELAARVRGEQLTLPRTESALVGKRDIKLTHLQRSMAATESLPARQEFEFHVEGGAERLNVFLSARNLDVDTWSPGFTLSGPGGEVITTTNQNMVSVDPYYILIKVPTPTPGTWKLEMYSQGPEPQFSFVAAHVENPMPDLLVDAVPTVALPGDEVSINAQASFLADLDDKVDYTGTVRRPDGTTMPLTFTYDPITRTVSAPFSNYQGRGIYMVEVTCRTLAGVQVAPGEPIFSGPERPAVTVDQFTRAARTSFFYATHILPPCDNDDCDGDGIPNDVETDIDIDGDGLPCSRDDDCDGDDVPDAIEGTDDDDNDNIPNFQDIDSNNDGILDGRIVPGKVPDLRDRPLWFSLHAGYGFPMESFAKAYEPGACIVGNFEYKLKRVYSLIAFVGYHAFPSNYTKEESFTSLSVNIRKYWSHFGWLAYTQAGPGYYVAKDGSSETGLNAGVGYQFAVKDRLALEVGPDIHYVATSGDATWFIDLKLGISFSFK